MNIILLAKNVSIAAMSISSSLDKWVSEDKDGRQKESGRGNIECPTIRCSGIVVSREQYLKIIYSQSPPENEMRFDNSNKNRR